MLSFFFFVPLHTAFSALPFTPFSPHFVYFFLDFIFHRLSSLFCIFVSTLQAWHWTCREVLPSAAMGSVSVHQSPCSSRAGHGGKSSTRSGRRSKQTKYVHFMSWARDSSENSQMGTQRSQAAVEHLCTHFTWCEGWSRSRNQSKFRSLPDESVRVMKQSAFHPEQLYLVWTFAVWILGVISAFLLSVFDICIKHLWKNSLFPMKHYFYAQQRVNTIACFSPSACCHFWLWEAAFSFLVGPSVHMLKTHVPSSCISLSISVFPLFLGSAWER